MPSTQFLAPEKLRGCGGLLLDAGDRRFVDELATRDVVAAAMMAVPGRVAWLLLGSEGAHTFGEGTLGFYASKGLVAKVDNAAAAAAHMGVQPDVLVEQLSAYNEAAAAAAADTAKQQPKAGYDITGKRFFPGSVALDAPMWLARVTPVTHYTMGGLAVGPDAAVLSAADGAPLPHIWAAGEAAGGLHGANRLGG